MREHPLEAYLSEIAKNLSPHHPDYWTRLEHQYAGQAIPAVVERHALDGHVHDEATVARDAVALARALIAELRKGEVGDE